jgi:hypothetical protein
MSLLMRFSVKNVCTVWHRRETVLEGAGTVEAGAVGIAGGERVRPSVRIGSATKSMAINPRAPPGRRR